jgi:hypothetical protein
MEPALEGGGIHLGQIHAAAGNLGFSIALIARPGEGVGAEQRHEALAFVPAQLGQSAFSWNVGLVKKLGHQPMGKMTP